MTTSLLDDDLSEFEVDIFASQFLVDRCEGLNLQKREQRSGNEMAAQTSVASSFGVAYFVLNSGLLIFIKVNFNQSGSVLFDTSALANDLSWVDQIVESGLMDSGQSTAWKKEEDTQRVKNLLPWPLWSV